MSKQQSWDASRDDDGEIIADGWQSAIESWQRGRFVEWPKGAPPQEDVPHAGTEVEWAGFRGVVTYGIPYERHDTRWALEFRTEGGITVDGLLDELRVIPEKRTVTGEVVGHLHVTSNGGAAWPSDVPQGRYALIREDT